MRASLESGCRPVTVRRLEMTIKESIGEFQPRRRYDLLQQPGQAALFCAMQTFYLGIWPKDMSTYFESGTPDHILVTPLHFFGFAGIFEAETRKTLLAYFQSDKTLGTSRANINSLVQTSPVELEGAISIREQGGQLVLQPAVISERENDKWRPVLKDLCRVIDDYFSHRGCPLSLLPETFVVLRANLPLLFSRESFETVRSLMPAGF